MKALAIALSLLLPTLVFAQSDPPVKVSVSGISQVKGKSSCYVRTKSFATYGSLDGCLKAWESGINRYTIGIRIQKIEISIECARKINIEALEVTCQVAYV